MTKIVITSAREGLYKLMHRALASEIVTTYPKKGAS